jgi:hypothetical protein
MRQDIERLLEIAAKARPYASFFEWPDKEQKELGVVEELIASLNARVGRHLRNLRPQRPDPPDCICDDADGKAIGIEVSEVVCDIAASKNARGQKVYRVWQPGELTHIIGTRLEEKDKKTFHGGPYASIIVCLFTDEPALTHETVVEELHPKSFGPFRQISAAYLLFSYDPGSKSYPVVPLRLAA